MQIRVLIVDDDFRVAGIHAAYVERTEGFVVVGQAHTSADATRMAGELLPDLVLMDLYLPDGNGLDVVRALREEAQPPDVIVISAARELHVVRAAMQLGAVHYVVKPFGYEVLAERLAAYRRLRTHLERLDDAADQAEVDELFGLLRPPGVSGVRPAKGHSAPTLELIRDAVRTCDGDISALEVAERVGVSRATAQRYLNYLEQHGVVKLNLRYGATGRPEHRYRLR